MSSCLVIWLHLPIVSCLTVCLRSFFRIRTYIHKQEQTQQDALLLFWTIVQLFSWTRVVLGYMKGACQTTQQTGFRFSSREYFACTCTNRNDGDMDTSALLPFVHGSKYVVPFVFTTCYVFPPLLPPFIDGTECVVLYDLVFLCIRFQYRRRSSSYCLSSWGRVELRPLRFIISRDVHSLSYMFWAGW